MLNNSQGDAPPMKSGKGVLSTRFEYDPGVLAIDSFLTEEQEENILRALADESADSVFEDE